MTNTDDSTISFALPYVLGRGEGSHYHFLNHLATTKLEGGTGSAMAAVEFVAPRGFGPPLHVHNDEDQILVVLEGDLAFRSGDTEATATTGGFAWLPHGEPHTFQVLSDTARFLSVTSGTERDPTFDRFVATLGVPTEVATLPTPGKIDPARVATVSAAHGITVLGPPPPPLP